MLFGIIAFETTTSLYDVAGFNTTRNAAVESGVVDPDGLAAVITLHSGAGVGFDSC
jgi:hypothetical protein